VELRNIADLLRTHKTQLDILIEPHLPPLWAQKSECWGLGICLDALWNMTLLAILKVNRANWLLVLEIKLELRKNVSTIDKISLLVRQH
jgi:hypothetical protein